jgi:hypothetical protein
VLLAATLPHAWEQYVTFSSNRDQARQLERAEALFKKEQQRREGAEAMAEYEAGMKAVRERTARLRALRLAREAAQTPAGDAQPDTQPSGRKKRRAT